MTKSVSLKIDNCTECPHCRTERDFSEDSFETLERWDCKFTGTKKNIRRYVDWYDKDKFIPNWCPLIKEKKKK